MTEKTYVKEIPCLRVDINYDERESTINKVLYNLILPHLHSEFKNKENNTYVSVSCRPIFFTNDDEKQAICDYIKQNIVDENTIVFFDNAYEGNTFSCFNGIYNIINILNLNPKKCFFLSGGMQADTHHNEFCNSHKISTENKINVIIINTWERHMHHDVAKNSEKFNFIIENKKKNFLCFNRILRFHRVALLGLLYEKELVDNSFYSFFPTKTYGKKSSPFAYINDLLSEKTNNIVKRNIFKNMKNFPLLLNNLNAENTNGILETDCELYHNSYFSLVTETFFFKQRTTEWDETSVFFSEKIFKPISCKHPFVLVGIHNSLHYLRELGYKTFSPYIDETYDIIENDEERLLAVVAEVERLCNQTPEEWIKWLENIEPIVTHNYNMLKNKTDSQNYIYKDIRTW
jgi:hypothetical protein